MTQDEDEKRRTAERRELIVAIAMAGLLAADATNDDTFDKIATKAIWATDALMARLAA